MNQTEATPDFQGSQVSLEEMQNTKKTPPPTWSRSHQDLSFHGSFEIFSRWKHSQGLIWDGFPESESLVCFFFFSKMDIWKSEKNMCFLWATQLSETSLGWKWT